MHTYTCTYIPKHMHSHLRADVWQGIIYYQQDWKKVSKTSYISKYEWAKLYNSSSHTWPAGGLLERPVLRRKPYRSLTQQTAINKHRIFVQLLTWPPNVDWLLWSANRQIAGNSGCLALCAQRWETSTHLDSGYVKDVEASWNVMAHAQKPDFVFRRNGRVLLNRRGASVHSTAGGRGVRISGSNAGYTMFRGSVKGTGYPVHLNQ